MAKPRKQRPREQQRRADALGEHAIHRIRVYGRSVYGDIVGTIPAYFRPQRLDDLQKRCYIPNARDVVQRHRFRREHRGCQAGQRSVLVAGGANPAFEPVGWICSCINFTLTLVSNSKLQDYSM